MQLHAGAPKYDPCRGDLTSTFLIARVLYQDRKRWPRRTSLVKPPLADLKTRAPQNAYFKKAIPPIYSIQIEQQATILLLNQVRVPISLLAPSTQPSDRVKFVPPRPARHTRYHARSGSPPFSLAPLNASCASFLFSSGVSTLSSSSAACPFQRRHQLL